MSWFVITCTSRREFSIRDEIAERGFNCLAPVEHYFERPCRHSKRREHRQRPLLLGYLFVEAAELPWRIISEVPGVRGFLSEGDEPYRLRPNDIERLLALSSIEAAPDIDPDRPLKPGDDAVIVSGPYAGKRIRVMDIIGNDAGWIGKMLGAMRTMKTPLTRLQAA
jgi:transcription antitermination factor NusG